MKHLFLCLLLAGCATQPRISDQDYTSNLVARVRQRQPPTPPGCKPAVMEDPAHPTHFGLTVSTKAKRAFALPPPLPCAECPHLQNWQIAYDDFTRENLIYFDIGNLSLGTYEVEQSQDMAHWSFVDLFDWWGPDLCCWPVDYPTFPTQTFFRVKGSGSSP